MEYNKEKGEIILNRELSKLDRFVIDFTSLLDSYVIVSGYVSILFGRARATEDIDILIPKINNGDFYKVWEIVHKHSFKCINTSKSEEAFQMLAEHAIRFFKKTPVPNIELKVIKNDLDKYSFDNKIRVILRGGILHISPIEMQIAYKLFLGSEKDIEDAKHLYELFKEKLDNEKLLKIADKLKVSDNLEIIK